MEPHSQNNDSPDSKQALEGQLRECFGRVVYSHKTHEKNAEIFIKRLSRIKFWQIVLSAITTGGCILVLLGAGLIGSIIASILSALLLCLTLYIKDYNLGELAQKHKQAANDIWIIREKYESLITDLATGNKTSEAILREREILMEDLHLVYSSAPSTSYQAYREAQKALKQNEDMTFSDEEIDAFLPNELKRDR